MKDEIAKKLHSLIGDHDCLLNSPETCKACQIFNVFNKSLNETISKVREEESKKREVCEKFLTWLFQEVFEGSPDGGDIQDKAEEMGLLIRCKVDRNDERYKDWCDEYDSDEMYFPYWTEEAKKTFEENK